MNRAVALYQRIKIKGKWTFQKVFEELAKLDSGIVPWAGTSR